MFTIESMIVREAHYAPIAHLAAAAADEELPETVELEVEVSFDVYGRYWPGNREEPPEYPELEISEVQLIETGKCIYDQLTQDELDAIEAECWEYLDNVEPDYPF
jgi:hypothetical protein